MSKNKLFYLVILLAVAGFLKFYLTSWLEEDQGLLWQSLGILLILGIGTFFVLRGTANVIEETTEVLSTRTKLAGGLLQSIGTAFPDMVLGVAAAITSWKLVATDYNLAINFAIIAAATTFGSNIYNIGHAAWCIWRQNLANQQNKVVAMLPKFKPLGEVLPMSSHKVKPSLLEIDNALDVCNALTLLTAIVAISMVLFGKSENAPEGFNGDLYQLIRPVGIVVFLLTIFVLHYFRKTHRPDNPDEEVVEAEKYYQTKSNWFIFINLLMAGGAILFAAESMVHAIEVFCHLTGVPFVIAGALAGIIGCMGEMMVIHNFTVNPNGRIGDAVVGVAMDNIVTTMGASIVAMIGGIFLGGNALILIFVLILTLNAVLMWQIARLKNFFVIK